MSLFSPIIAVLEGNPSAYEASVIEETLNKISQSLLKN